MALVVKDRVKETTTTTGTGSISLEGAVTKFKTFSSALSDGDTTYYAIEQQGDDNEFEIGIGTYASSGNTLARTTILSSSNSNNAVDFSAGTKNIFITYPADKAVYEDASGNISIPGTIDGRDLATDGSKLDGIEANATADQTASEILTAVKTVDGASSGLDADLLDGQEGSYYTNAANLTGTLPAISGANLTGVQAASVNVTESSDDNVNYNVLFSDTGGSGNVQMSPTQDDNGITFNPYYNKLVNGGVIQAGPRSDDHFIFQGYGADTTSEYVAMGVQTGYASLTAGGVGSTSTDLRIRTANSGTEADRVTIKSDGKTGIGTTSPAEALDVVGNISVSGTVDGRDLATDGTKLDGIEASADVTDTANVTAAGALMDSEVTNLSQVKAFDSSDYAAASHTHTFGNITSTSLGSSDDLDSYTTRALAHWSSSNPSNSPSTYGAMLVIPDGSQSQQLVQTYGGATNKVSLYGRRRTGGTWDTSWTQYFSDHYHPNADKWTTSRTLSLTGDVTGSVSWDGSGNASLSTTVANDSHTHDGRYYTETEADSRFVNVTGDTIQTLQIGTNTVSTTSDIALSANVAINAENSLSFGMTDGTSGYYRWMFGNTSNTGGTAGGTEKMRLNKDGNLTLSGTVDGVDIAARDAVLTSTTTTANAALPKSGGEMTGALTIDVDNVANGALRIEANQTDTNNDFYFAQEIVSTLSGSQTATSDREQGGLWMDVNSSNTGGDTSNEHRVYGAYLDVDSTGSADLVYGIYSNVAAAPTTGTTSSVYGGWFQGSDIGGAGEVTNVYGISAAAKSDNSDSDANNLYAGYFKTYNAVDTGDIGSATAVYGEIEIPSGTGDHYGTSYVFNAQYDNNDTTAQTNTTYLYYGNYAGTLPTTAYGVYIADDVKNYFGGSVGIGDTAPSQKLNVSGNIMLEGADQFMYLTNVGTGNNGIYVRGNTSGNYLRNHSTGIHTWEVTGSEKMRIDSSGNVGIGTSSPDALTHIYSGASGVTNPHSYTKLHVESASHSAIQLSGSTSSEQWIFFADDTSSTPVGGIVYYHGSNYMGFQTNGAERMRLTSGGDLHVDGNVIAYSTTISDERLKEDIKPITGALDKVGQLSGYTFTYKNDGKQSAGVIAQEVEAVLPSAVTESTLPLKTDDGVEYKTVQYDQLHGLLIEAIKELKAEIEELKRGSAI